MSPMSEIGISGDGGVFSGFIDPPADDTAYHSDIPDPLPYPEPSASTRPSRGGSLGQTIRHRPFTPVLNEPRASAKGRGKNRDTGGNGGGGGDGGDSGGGGDDDGGDGDNDESEEEVDNLITARAGEQQEFLKLLTRIIRKPSSDITVKNPETFDGSEETKLRTFIVQCQLVFNNKPRAFKEDSKKVTFAVSYLRGQAFSWFEPYLFNTTMNGKIYPFMTNYRIFLRELSENFGPRNYNSSLEAQLENLSMRENQPIAHYMVEFNSLATQIEWGNNALRHQFYTGLPNRIQDRISEVGKPAGLREMKELAQTIDARYWERQEEKSRKAPRHFTNSDSRNSSASKESSSSAPQRASNIKPNAGKMNSSGRTSGPSGGKPDLSDKLTKDGRLTPEERQRRRDHNLCMFCGLGGHIAADCRKAASAKGRAAATSAPNSAPTSDSTSEADLISLTETSEDSGN